MGWLSKLFGGGGNKTPEPPTDIKKWLRELQEVYDTHRRSGHSTTDTDTANRRMNVIGHAIYQQGGDGLMEQVFQWLPDFSISRSVSWAWNGIGKWSSSEHDR